MKEGYIKQSDRKKILLLTDDIRVHSGVAQVGREIIHNSTHRYNWCQIAGSVKHPDKGQVHDVSSDIAKETGVEDSYVKLYPVDGYGNEDILREVIRLENPDAIFLITDPRYFMWLFGMEEEIRTKIPIVYLNIWDDLPAPQYNEEFYDSCDALFGISKQTKIINEIVLGDNAKNKILKYVPHGLDTKKFFPLKEETKDFKDFKKHITKGVEKDFILFFNSRNIRRKSIPDSLAAWKMFIDTLSPEEKEKVLFVLHTDPVSDHGTDLPAVIEYLLGEDDNTVIISNQKLPHQHMNYLYNMADGVILISAAEGWGLALTESMLTGTPFIANVVGGMQDQMRFVDNEGNWFTPDDEIPSNHTGRFKKHGEWAFPVFPSSRSIQGSIPTPYIWDDRCKPEDAVEHLLKLYNMSREERKTLGLKGREWALSNEAGFSAQQMGERIIEGMNELFNIWKPRESYEFINVNEEKSPTVPHKLLY